MDSDKPAHQRLTVEPLFESKYSEIESVFPEKEHRQSVYSMCNSFSILYQTYLTQNLFLTSSHQTPVSFFKTGFWLYESFICRVFKLIFSSEKVQTNFTVVF